MNFVKYKSRLAGLFAFIGSMMLLGAMFLSGTDDGRSDPRVLFGFACAGAGAILLSLALLIGTVQDMLDQGDR